MIKYVDLSTKIRGMKGKMLTQEDFSLMMDKKSVKDVALYLKDSTYYKEALEDMNADEIHRGRLEVLLYRAVVKDALKIAKHLTGKEKKIYRYVYRKLEIEDIKKMLRTLSMNQPLSSLDRSTMFVSRYSKIDFNDSLEAKDIPALIETFKDTNFYVILKPLLTSTGDLDLFTAEMSLDMYYYNRTAKQMKKIAAEGDREILEDMFGREADFKNLYWIYRAMKHYGIPKEMIRRYIIPFHYKVKENTLNELLEAKNVDALIGMINKTYYGKYIDFSLETVEIQYLNHMHKIQEKSMRMEPFSIAPIIGYMFLKEMEVHNITNIVEGIRYSIQPDAIRQYLVSV